VLVVGVGVSNRAPIAPSLGVDLVASAPTTDARV